jgi:hypothetical protein
MSLTVSIGSGRWVAAAAGRRGDTLELISESTTANVGERSAVVTPVAAMTRARIAVRRVISASFNDPARSIEERRTGAVWLSGWIAIGCA